MSIQDKDEDDANNSDSLLWRSGLLLRSKALTGTLLNTVRACILMEIHSFLTVFAADLGAHAHSLPVVHVRRRAFGRVLNCVVLSDARLPPLPLSLSRSLSERARSSAPSSYLAPSDCRTGRSGPIRPRRWRLEVQCYST